MGHLSSVHAVNGTATCMAAHIALTQPELSSDGGRPSSLGMLKGGGGAIVLFFFPLKGAGVENLWIHFPSLYPPPIINDWSLSQPR